MKAFLSHTGADKDLVSIVQEKLTQNNAWYDAVDIENGESIPEKINEGLRIATHYVLFWSEKASNAPWVRAELNAAFVQMMAGKCKFMIFLLDETKLPELLQPYKYTEVDKTNLDLAATLITDEIMSHGGADIRLSRFVNRTREIGQIEEDARAGYKLIILHGLLGIGKSSLAEKAMLWLYPNRATNIITLDFNSIPGIAELSIELSRRTKAPMLNDNCGDQNQKTNIQYFFEVITASNYLLILKNVKGWLNEDGTLSDNLRFVTDLVIKTEMFNSVVIMTSSRFVELPNDYFEKTSQFPLKGMNDTHISDIIKYNLPTTFEVDTKKNLEFAKRLQGYPLAAKLSAYRISNHGYEYYLQQPSKIQQLKIGLAKEFIDYAGLSPLCQKYLRIQSLSKSRLRSEEYEKAFPELKNQVAALADEAFFSGILSFDEDGCYKLESIVEDYFYDLAFNSPERKDICGQLESFLAKEIKAIQDTSCEKYMRLVPAAVRILALNGKVAQARSLRAELTATIISSMWDQYNHADYDEAFNTATSLLEDDESNFEALYVKAICLIRLDDYKSAETILNQLLIDDARNCARCYYSLGRIQKQQGQYEAAIELFQLALYKRARYLSPHREMADCYIHMGNFEAARTSIANAKKIDDSNIYVILLEAQLLQKEGSAAEAINLLSGQSLLERSADQILFRRGRAYDQLGQTANACECYNNALQWNPRMYDAKLCLLNHEIIDNPEKVTGTISELKKKLRGKRKAILTNIEARFIGYNKHQESEAIQLLGSVDAIFRDRQWYAVKIQLLEKMIEKQRQAGRNMLANQFSGDLDETRKAFAETYDAATLVEADFLPDT